MNNEINIQEKIQNIVFSEGEKFEYDEDAIKSEYSKIQTDKSNLAIKILSIAGGFLATLAFAGFLIIAGLYDSKVGLVFTGLLFIGASIWLNVAINKLIIDTLSVSLYGIGYFLIAFGLGELIPDKNIISILFVLISLTALYITQNYILSFISILIINGSILYLIIYNQFYYSFHLYSAFVLFFLTFVFLYEAKIITMRKSLSKLYNPLRIGLVISLIIVLVFVGKRGFLDPSVDMQWITSIFSIPLTIYVISIIIKTLGVKEKYSKVIIYILSTLILLPTAFSPAISGSLLIILLSFLVNYKLGLSIGIIAFVYFISQFYYDMNFTLLTKSILLFSSGIIFLLFFFLTHKKLGSNEEV